MAITIEAEFRKLKKRNRRNQTKYFVLLSNQAVIIDIEWEALSRARKYYPGKRIEEMYPMKRKNRKSTVTTLTHILEQNENKASS